MISEGRLWLNEFWIFNLKFGTKDFVMMHILPFKGKLTVPLKLSTQNLILGPWFSKTLRIEAQFKFQDVRGCRELTESVREFIESSFETFKWKRTFCMINFVRDTQLTLWGTQECQQDRCVAWMLYIMIVYRSIKFTKRTYMWCFSETFWSFSVPSVKG